MNIDMKQVIKMSGSCVTEEDWVFGKFTAMKRRIETDKITGRRWQGYMKCFFVFVFLPTGSICL